MEIHYNYIIIEGCIGAGKTTFSKMLSSDLNARLILEQFEDNSFLPKFYREPEKYAFPLELSFLAERYQQLKKEATPGDLFHRHTVSDYFIQKSLIFAKATLQDDEFNLYQKLFQIIHPQLPSPDLVLYLYNPVDRLLENIKKRGRSYETQIPSDYLERIQQGYLDYFRLFPNNRIVIVDASRLDFVSSQNDYEYLKNLLLNDYSIGINRV